LLNIIKRKKQHQSIELAVLLNEIKQDVNSIHELNDNYQKPSTIVSLKEFNNFKKAGLVFCEKYQRILQISEKIIDVQTMLNKLKKENE
jgi:hypothetical protein